MNLRGIIVLCVCVLWHAAPAVRAELAVRLAPEDASLFVYEPFTLRLEVESDAPPETPSLPTLPDVAVVTVRRLPADPVRRKYEFQITLISQRDGSLTIPPFAVRAAGESGSTPALRLSVRTPRRATEMELTVAVEPTALRVGQPATVTVTWTSSVAFSRCKQLLLEIPLLDDDRCSVFPLDPPAPEDQPPVPEDQRIGLPVNNIRVVAHSAELPDRRRSLTFRYKLVPREPCVLRASAARLACALLAGDAPSGTEPSHFYNHFFSAPEAAATYERVYLSALIPEIKVRAITEPGRNSRFAEIVGPCTLRAAVTPARLVVGQAALLTVTLEDLAFGRHITALPPAAFAGLRAEFQLSAEPIREMAAERSRSFTYVLRPLQAGVSRIPAIVLQTFNPQSGRYETWRTAPLPIAVAADPANTSGAIAARIDAKAPIPLNGIRHNQIHEEVMTTVRDILELLGRYWWALVPLAPLVWLALRPLARRWERCRCDPVYARAVTALARFRRAVRRDEETAWRNYLADRLDLCAAALTADSVTDALRARTVDEGLVAATRARFEERDAADYGRRAVTPSASTRNLVRRLHKATMPLLLVWGLMLAHSAWAAEDTDQLFARAVRMQAEKPDEAQPLFAEAALRFESSGQFLSAGNAWFFAGESGRALANYRGAQRRSPFDGQLRASIAFVRANRADAFPAPAAATGKVAAFWRQFCTWMPVLRRGLFVAAYLFVWTLFLAAQLRGWRPGRAVWIALAVLALVPLVSLLQTSFAPAEGVVIEDAVARLGPGYAYDPAFQQPLHKAAEFAWLEARQGWVRVGLPDGAEGWLRESDCMKIP